MLQAAVALFCFVICGLAVLKKYRATRVNASSYVAEKKWEYPEPDPDYQFDLEKTPAPEFRAFKYAYTRQRSTIEVKKLDKNSWVLLDNQFPLYHHMKVNRIAERGIKSCKTLQIATEAAKELCYDLCEFLSRRYPHIYKIERSTTNFDGWYGEGIITRIEIPALNVSYDLNTEDPLLIAGLIQPADLNILVKRDDGQYQLSAMMLGIGGGQRIKDKLGKSLADLHLGNVPHYASQLQRPLDRFLAKLKIEEPFCRNTTAISIHDEYHWPTSTMGPEDDWDPVIGGPGVGTPSHDTFQPPKPVTDISQMFFRQERQTLRRLPKSKAIVWAVHTYISPLESILHEPGIPGRLASLIRSWDDELAKHKGRHLYAEFLLPYLDTKHKEQVAGGICLDGQLPSSFPY